MRRGCKGAPLRLSVFLARAWMLVIRENSMVPMASHRWAMPFGSVDRSSTSEWVVRSWWIALGKPASRYPGVSGKDVAHRAITAGRQLDSNSESEDAPGKDPRARTNEKERTISPLR